MDTTSVQDILVNTLPKNDTNADNIQDLLLRLGINCVAILILVFLIYFKRHKNKDFVFTFIVFNALIFLVCYLLSSAKMKMGVAFGIFAIFSILRYRTVSISIREMTYFFTCVTIGIINAMTNISSDFLEIAFANFFILIVVFVLDRFFTMQQNTYKNISYDKLELLRPENKSLLIDDLKKRTGLPIIDARIDRIDLVKNICKLRVYFSSEFSLMDTDRDTNEEDDDD